jgi:hypothetical protein
MANTHLRTEWAKATVQSTLCLTEAVFEGTLRKYWIAEPNGFADHSPFGFSAH